MSDYIVRATAADSQIRAFAITSKEMVEEARRAHDTRPVITAALGRLLSGAAMMGTMMKGDNDLLTIQIQCGGPIAKNSKKNITVYAKWEKVVVKKGAVKKVTVTGTSKTISKLSKGKNYYVKVRAYKKDSTGAKVYGSFSSVKKVKISK